MSTRTIWPHMSDDEIRQRWPVRDVLVKLADAADHLLAAHDCDNHGWEEVSFAVQAARLHALQMAAPSGASPTDTNPTND